MDIVQLYAYCDNRDKKEPFIKRTICQWLSNIVSYRNKRMFFLMAIAKILKPNVDREVLAHAINERFKFSKLDDVCNLPYELSDYIWKDKENTVKDLTLQLKYASCQRSFELLHRVVTYLLLISPRWLIYGDTIKVTRDCVGLINCIENNQLKKHYY